MITRIEPPRLCSRTTCSWARGIMAIPLADEKVSGRLEISQMSACRVMAQNGSKPSGVHQWTGDSARSRVQSSWGTPLRA